MGTLFTPPSGQLFKLLVKGKSEGRAKNQGNLNLGAKLSLTNIDARSARRDSAKLGLN
jgi:hypothetical protein